jgi:hypothetical protein
MTRGLRSAGHASPSAAIARGPRNGMATATAPGMAPETGPAGTGSGTGAAGIGRAPARARGFPGLAILFLLSLLPQISFKIGPLLLKPYRIVLLVLFLPLLVRLCLGAAGRMLAVDWLMIGASLWAALALMMNHPAGEVIEPVGVVLIEFLGAYLIARVCIRSAEDFRRVVRLLFGIILVLLAFAVAESVTRQPILLQMLGQGAAAVDAGIRFGLRRAQAVFAHPIHYGAFVSAGLGLVWYALRPDAGLVRRAVCALVIALSTFFSLSAGALLAFLIQCGFIAWELVTAPNPRRWRIFAWCCLAGYVLLDLIATRTPFHTLVHHATFSSRSGYNRILIWQYGTDNVIANPFFGIGLNDWERPGWMGSSVDNFWLLLAMQYGLPFLLLFAGALYLILRRLSRQRLPDAVDRACRAGYLTTAGGVALAGGTVHYWQAMFAFVLFIFGMGVWMISGGARPAPAELAPAELGDRHDPRGRRAGPGGEGRRRRPVL